MNSLQLSLNDQLWLEHKIGNTYTMDGKPELWKIAYYPLFGSWNNSVNKQGETIEEKWVDFIEPRALIEKPITGGTDFREVPLRYLTKTT